MLDLFVLFFLCRHMIDKYTVFSWHVCSHIEKHDSAASSHSLFSASVRNDFFNTARWHPYNLVCVYWGEKAAASQSFSNIKPLVLSSTRRLGWV